MRGTVEFRLKEGTTTKADLMNWPLWCGWFVQKCTGLTDKEVMWWMKQPPKLIELAERFTASTLGGARMPKSVLKWVEAKIAEAAKPRAKTPKKEQPPASLLNEAATASLRQAAAPQFEFRNYVETMENNGINQLPTQSGYTFRWERPIWNLEAERQQYESRQLYDPFSRGNGATGDDPF